MYSWVRKNFTRINNQDTQKLIKIEDEQCYGVTNQFIEFIKSFSFDTFKQFPLPEEQSDDTQKSSIGIRVDLSEWQQQHATMILSKVKELSQLRYTLCPRHLKERQFWRIYFTVVKSHLTEYELRAKRLDKLREMAAEEDTKCSDTNGIELEMTEPNHSSKLASP